MCRHAKIRARRRPSWHLVEHNFAWPTLGICGELAFSMSVLIRLGFIESYQCLIFILIRIVKAIEKYFRKGKLVDRSCIINIGLIDALES